jgi:radical SAM superfamily enzyme YgiQ (UPF0313 family)
MVASPAVLVVPPFDDTYPGANSPLGDRLGVGYLAAALRRAGIETEVIHCPIENLSASACAERVVAGAPRLVGLSTLFSDTDVVGAVALAQALKARRPDLPVVIGGYPVAFTAQDILHAFPQVDAVALGEGEATWCDLAQQVLAQKDWQAAPGLAVRRNGQPVLNAPRPSIGELDTLPFPARDILHLLPPNQRFVTMNTSRGCYHRCAFCSIPPFYRLSPGKVWRGRSPANVADEIEQLKQDWQLDSVQFIDENFMGPGRIGKERAYGIAKQMIHRKLNVQWAFECRADGVDESLFAFLKCTGLRAIFLGIDSGVQRVLDFFNKGITVETNRKALDILDRLGIECHAGFINFEPSITPEELGENLRFFRETGLWKQSVGTSHFLSSLQIYRGIPLEETLGRQGKLEPVLEPGLGGYVNKYHYDFSDPRTGALFSALSVIYQKKLQHALFFAATRFEQTWRDWYTRLSHATALPESCLDQVAELQGPFFKEQLSNWIRARNAAIFESFEALVEHVSGLDPSQVQPELGWELQAYLAQHVEAVDRAYLGTSLEDKTEAINTLLAASPLRFAYQGQSFEVAV